MANKTSDITNLEKACINFLSNPRNTRTINFTLYSYKVDSTAFSMVALGIRTNQIQVQYDRKRPVGDAGSYLITNNTMVVGKQSSLLEAKGLIIHEAVHAHQDMLARTMKVEHAESIAYVAQSIFEVEAGRFSNVSEPTLPIELYNYFVKGKCRFSWKQLENDLFANIQKFNDGHGKALYDFGGSYLMDGVSATTKKNK